MQYICKEKADGRCEGISKGIDIKPCMPHSHLNYRPPNWHCVWYCYHLGKDVICVPVSVKEDEMDDNTVVTIKKADLIKAAEKAGSHRDVIEALCPEVFKKKFEAKVGDVYKLERDGDYVMICCAGDGYTLNKISGSSGLWHGNYHSRIFNCLADVTTYLNDNTNITYIGHASEVIKIERGE